MKPSEILKYYLDDRIIEKLLKGSGREYAVKYGDKFGKRPMILQYRSDVERLVKQGATSFHVSEERWSNPLLLSTDLKKEDLDNMRQGWDFLIDVDCKVLEVSKLFTKLVIDELSFEGLQSFSVKFSGGSGFHILVPYESFPGDVNKVPINKLFPDAPMILSKYIKEALRNKIRDELGKDYGSKRLAAMFSIDEKSLLSPDGNIDPYRIIEIDTVLISERHLFRMQYSLNEKKWLVSLPIEKNKVMEFNEKDALYTNVDTSIDFFDLHPRKDEAKRLFQDAYDAFSQPEEEKTAVREFTTYHLDLVEKLLPPCIKTINNGLSDGRKRSVFILTNFYRSIGKNKEEVKSLLLAWNQRNKPPLKEGYVQQQVDYIFNNQSYPPPNCDAPGYYKYFNVCFPDETCKLIKNPLSYYIRKRGKTEFAKKR